MCKRIQEVISSLPSRPELFSANFFTVCNDFAQVLNSLECDVVKELQESYNNGFTDGLKSRHFVLAIPFYRYCLVKIDSCKELQKVIAEVQKTRRVYSGEEILLTLHELDARVSGEIERIYYKGYLEGLSYEYAMHSCV